MLPASHDGTAHLFEGLRVIEVAGDPAGEMVGKLLAEMGADVVKVEPPGGSPTRSIGPFAYDRFDADHSLTFWYYNTNKRSAVLDYATPEGQAALGRLLADADVFISTLRPPELRDLGLDLDDLRQVSENLIVLSITPFGLDGPWADWLSSDLVGLALGSPLNSCGYDDHSIPPIRPGGDQGYQSAASFALMGLLLALVERQQTHRGQLVDVGMHDCLAVSAELANPYWFYPKVIVYRQTCRHAQPTPTQPAIFQCGDDRWVYFVIFVADQKGWRTLVEWIDSKGLAVDLLDPEYDDPEYRQAHFDHIQEVVEVFFLLQTADEAYHEGQARGLAIGPINAPDDLLDDLHLKAREFFVPVEHDDVPPALYPGVPFRFSGFGSPDLHRAPKLGEHTAEVLGHIPETEVPANAR
ncbi:MAG TPA: CaiB/BaiF CoA-transferase family protein [Acidimicrobiales bacterium]|nr:CaiB/BaiF CoA-transferase family protein [Acidimicrobiales bacterium]